jgi:hypothetical protein
VGLLILHMFISEIIFIVHVEGLLFQFGMGLR